MTTRLAEGASVHRVLDRLLSMLMGPRGRRVRRWSFVATVPLGLLIAHIYGVQEGVLVVAARMALVLAVALVAWRLGGERGEAMRDLLMHPRARAFARAEVDIVCALPRLLAAGLTHAGRAGTGYAQGTFGLALALAFTPAVLAETLAMHLLLGDGVIAWVSTALHAYSLIWLWSFALGPRAYPHRVGARSSVLRAGPMYRVVVPRGAITSATARRARVAGERGFVERDGAVLLPVRGRVDVWLELSEPVRVQRPLSEPCETRLIAVASDDPDGLVEQLLAPLPAATATRDVHAAGTAAGLLAGLDFRGFARDAAQPG